MGALAAALSISTLHCLAVSVIRAAPENCAVNTLLVALGFDLLIMLVWDLQVPHVAGLSSAENNNNPLKYMHTHIHSITNAIVLQQFVDTSYKAIGKWHSLNFLISFHFTL